MWYSRSVVAGVESVRLIGREVAIYSCRIVMKECKRRELLPHRILNVYVMLRNAIVPRDMHKRNSCVTLNVIAGCGL